MKQKYSNSRSANSLRNFATGIGGQFLSILLRFIARTVFIHTLGKEYLGISGLFTDVLTMLSLTELGMDTAIHYRMYKPLAEHDDRRIRILLNFYKQAYRVVGATILVLGLCLIPFLPYLIKDYDSLAKLNINAILVFILYLLQTVFTYLFFAYCSSVVIASQKKYLLDIANYIVTIIDYAVRIVVLIIWKSFIGYLIVGIFASLIKNVVRAIIAKKKYPQFFLKESGKLDKEEIRDMLKDCGALFTYKANTVVLKATDNLVLSSFIGLGIVGLYSNYLMLYTTLRNLLHQIYNAISASMGNLFAKEDTKKTYSFFQTMNYMTAIAYGTVSVGIAVCSNELICTWLSEEYVISQPFAVLIGIELLLSGLQSNLGQVRNASGIFQQLWYRPLIGIVVNVVVSVIMVNYCGIYGVIIGTIVAYVSTIFMVDPYVIHKYSFNNYKPVSEYYKKNLLYFAVLFIVGLLDHLFCSNVFVGHGWFSVIVHICFTGISVPIVFLILFKKTEECQYLLGVLKRLKH